jgi:acyl transferase domain-containing protein
MKKKAIFLFSGQGSQYYQMGRQIYEQNSTFQACMDQMDRQAQAVLGMSVVQALYGTNDKAVPFDDIRLSHPAIFMVECALAHTLIGMGITPEGTLGASLGTVAALVIAERLSTEDGLTLVLRQALAIERRCPKGGMIAVIGDVRLYKESPFLQARSVIAGRNFASHFVLSVPQDNLAAIECYLVRAGVSFQRLPVQYPFHSLWIDPVRDALRVACAGPVIRSTGGLPVICCAQAGFLKGVDGDYMWQVVRREIDFVQAIAQAEQFGPCNYLDLGPSGTLATSLRYLLPPSSNSCSTAIITPYRCESESLAAVLTHYSNARTSATMEAADDACVCTL